MLKKQSYKNMADWNLNFLKFQSYKSNWLQILDSFCKLAYQGILVQTLLLYDALFHPIKAY